MPLKPSSVPLPGFECVDCSINTNEIDEYYSVTDELWAQAGMKTFGGMLCIGCLEDRIKRRLISSDFIDYPINKIGGIFEHSERLKNRILSK